VTVDAGRRIALVAAMAVMVVGAGQWLLVSADVPRVAANTWAPAGDMGAVPEGTAAAVLADGRIVIAGGRRSDGTLVSQIGIFNPASQSWEDGGQLTLARTGHTATALEDGRVLIAGGRTELGASFDVEIYDPNTRQSVHAGDLLAARVNHAAATLGNGSVLIVGGSNGSGVLDDIELFDPETGQTQSLVTRMAVAREKLTATRLLDGHVLIAGGRNDSGDLATAEIFVSGSHSIFETGALKTARSGHAAVLLPNNNQVLIAGGTVNGAPVASAELYADWRDGFTVVANPMAHARTGAVAGVLPQHDLAFVGGGGSTSGEYFGYATVKTDKDDYWPGETVTITGSGWQPGETVALKISEDADTHNDFTFAAVADAQGNIVNTEFAPIENDVFHHFGMRFYLTATGGAATALNTFTDGNADISGIVTNSVTGAPISGAIVACTTGCNGNPPPSATTAANGSYGMSVNFPGGNTGMITLTASAGGYVTQSPQVPVTNGTVTKHFSLVPIARPTSTSVSCVTNPATVNAPATCTATVTDAGTGTPTAVAGSIAFATSASGTFSFPSCTLSGSPASCAVLYTPTARGTGPHAITGSYTPTSSHTGSSNAAGPFYLTVDKAAQATLTLTTPANLAYGTTGTASATGGSGTGAVTFNVGSSTGCSVDPISGAITVTNASGTCAISAEKAADDDYLAVMAGPNVVTLEKADADVTVAGFSGTYDGQPHGATGSATGIGGAMLPGLNLGESFTDAPGGTANWTFTGGTNYKDQSGSVEIVIGKAYATVNVSGYSGTYDAQPHGATGSATGIGGAALPGLNLGESFTDAPGGTANWTFDGGTNYFDQYGSVDIVIAKARATVSVTGYTGTYDGEAHSASGSATGVGGVDLGSQLNLGGSFTNVPGGKANWTFSGGTNYFDDSGAVDIVINQADATINVTPYDVTYDTEAHTAAGTATGVKGEDLSGLLDLSRTTHTVAGIYAADPWTFAGDVNYKTAHGTVDNRIAKATPTITITWANSVYNTNPNPASAVVDGVGNEVNLSPPAALVYYLGADDSGTPLGGAPVDAGTYTVKASFAGGDNYTEKDAVKTITIERATPAITITWANSTYDTNPNPASAVVDGVGGQGNLAPPATLVYYLGAGVSGTLLGGPPVDAGTYTVKASFAGNANYTEKDAVKTITINRADQQITFGALANRTFGDAAFTVSATGGASGQPVTFSSQTPQTCTVAPNGNSPAMISIVAVGQCILQASQAGNNNYNPAPDVNQSFSIAAWTAQGFHQPVGIPNSVFAAAPTAVAYLLAGPPTGAAWNSAKGGSTIPLKFNVFAAGVERTSTADILGFVARPLAACSGTDYSEPVEFETSGATVLRYDGVAGSGGQFIQNWKTPTVRSEQCFRVELLFRDQSVLYTFVKLKK
jgi:hypothetical protein